jgi:hypothetical protein
MVKYYILGVLIVLGVITLSISNVVKFKAIEKAGNFPYCIQIPSGSEYTEAKNFLDLSLFKMWGTGGNNHAVLVVGSEQKPKFFHWSYWNENFDDDAYGSPPVFCKPRNNFLAIKTKYREDNDNLNFYFVGRHFSIPRVYFPIVNWASRNALVFYAIAPEFIPPQSERDENYIDVVFGRIDVEFGKSPLLPAWFNTTNETFRVEKAESEFGLQKQLVWNRGNRSTGEIEKLSYMQYFIRSNGGDITTLIDCVSSNCTHIFQHNGWAYDFHHDKANLVKWNFMQNKLESLTNSFVVSN